MVMEMDKRYGERYKRIGLKIAYYRKLRGLTQEQLAEKSGLSMIFISQIEAPNMEVGLSLDALFMIADCLEVSPERLLKFDD